MSTFHIRPRSLRAVAALSAVSLVAVACGSDDDSTAADPAPADDVAPATTPPAGTDAASYAASDAASDGGEAVVEFDGPPIQLWSPYAGSFEAPMQAAAELCASRGIPVEATPFDLTYGELDLKVQVDAQAGAKPDIVLQGLNQLIPLDSNDFVVDLAPLAEGDDVVNDDTIPVLDAGRIGDRQLIVPWGISVPTVFVNTDIVAAAGVELDDLVSWEAIEEASATIAASGDDVYGVSFPLQEGWLPLQYLLTAGTELIDDQNVPVFNDDAGDAAIEHIHRLYTSAGAFPGDETASREAFAAGEVGMFIGSSAFIQQFADTSFEWTTLPFPPLEEGGDVVTAAGGAGVAIFADADRQAAAWEVLKCTLDPEILATYAVETIGYLPVRNDMVSALEPGLLEQAPYAAPWSQFGLAGPWLNFPGDDGPRALELFNEAWVEASQQSSDPTAVMDAAAGEIEGLLP